MTIFSWKFFGFLLKKKIKFDGKNPTLQIDDFFVKILWLITETKTLQFDGKNSTFRI